MNVNATNLNFNKYWMGIETEMNPFKYRKSIKYFQDKDAFQSITSQLNLNQAKNLRKILLNILDNMSKKKLNRAEILKQMDFIEGLTDAVELQAKINSRTAKSTSGRTYSYAA